MSYGERALDNPINWSFRAARVFGIDVRVHIAFVICAVVLVWMELPKPGRDQVWSLGQVLGDALGSYALLFLIVLLHEFGHCFGARHTGGTADEILLWPLGGLAMTNPPHNAAAHMITTLAGPVVNVLLCAVCSVVLVAWTGSLGAVPWNPLHPTIPVDQAVLASANSVQVWVMRFYGLSCFLLLVNLLPIFPFDGGRIVQAWLWPRKGYQGSMAIATAAGMIGAIIVALVGIFLEESWLVLMIAAFGYFTCWQTRAVLREGGGYGAEGVGYGTYGSGPDEQSGERKPGFFERRRALKAARKVQRARQRQEAHEQEVEKILRKISDSGLGSLTPREHRVLEEETERQRGEATERLSDGGTVRQ